MSAPTTAAAVANAFLRIQDRDPGEFPRIDPLKLQKLLFYSQAWWVALHPRPLFSDEIYAWPWGPVVPQIYSQFRDFGSRAIENRRATILQRTGNGVLDYSVEFPPTLSSEMQDFTQSVWDSHKRLSGIQLSNATHAPGEPWTIVKERYGDLENKPIIPVELIRDIFKSKLTVGDEDTTSA